VVTEVRKNLGDKVKKGEVLAVLNSRELSDLKSAYLSSAKRVELAKANFEREDRLFKKKISSEQDFLASKQALAETEIESQAAIQRLLALGLSKADLENISKMAEGNLARYELRVPFNGMIVEKHVAVGEAIKEDVDIFVIADLSTLWGEITVYAKDLRVVRLGQKATVRSKELGMEATGRISYLGSLVGEQTRSAKALVDIPNSKGLWRPGLFVTVELFQEEVPVPVAVSADAIQTFRGWNVVFVQYGNQFEVRPLELGRSDGKWVEVVSGLSAGEKYAARNSFVLKADLGKAGAAHDH
jgi:cobalt-zinc-cadmium efflux system membrane fusion protein